MSQLPPHTLGGVIATVIALAIAAADTLVAQSEPASSRPTQTAPAANRGAFDERRFEDLVAVIAGQNSLHARRTGARELLRQGWTETPARLTALLGGGQRSAKIAVALALSDAPDAMVRAYVDPLCEMLADEHEDVREAASAALADADDHGVIAALQALAEDESAPLTQRRAAIDTLGRMTQRRAIGVLAELLSDRDSPLTDSALGAFEQAAGEDFQGDFEAALVWWSTFGVADATEWRRLQIRRLDRQRRASRQRAGALEQRLAAALREVYALASEQKRPELLDSFLTDPLSAVRLLGLSLVQSRLTEGKTLGDNTVARTRELLTARDPELRAAAVRTIASLRDPSDAERFRKLLSGERDAGVRQALANGLGYVGSANDAASLIELLDHADPLTFGETVTALGRLAERGVLNEPTRAVVAAALHAGMSAAGAEDHALRERLLWAMSRLGDARFAEVFVAALGETQAPGVRLAAVRGVAVMLAPKTSRANGDSSNSTSRPAAPPAAALSQASLLDALVPTCADPDAAVRRAAVEILSAHAGSDAQLEALWSRIDAEREPEESTRVSAWRGAARVISGRPAAEIETWLGELPGDEATRRRLAIELLQLSAQRRDSKPDSREELGWIRARLAAEQAAAGRIEPAITAYLAALNDLGAAQSEQASRVALELLRLALLNGRYDEQLAAVLASRNPALDGATLWEGIRGEVESLIEPDEVDRAVAMLVVLQTHPPTSMPADTQRIMEEMLQRARAVRLEADAVVVRNALAALRAKPDDQQAREALTGRKALAISAARDALRAELQAEAPDASQVALLHDLLKQLSPEWTGFSAEASVEDKLKALEALSG